MRLQAFRIKDFRSIKDTDWQNLSPDHITALIGQNEAGKTGVIEALYSFPTGEIMQEHLRSDGTLPEVFCSFQVEWNEIKDLFKPETLPNELAKFITDKKRINLKRVWSNLETSKLSLEEKDFSILFEVPEIVEMIVTPETAAVIAPPADNTPEQQPAVVAETPVKKITEEEFINIVFKEIPIFETFEDYASLLPNVIDLEDLQNKNAKAEGYKGAENLLTIAGLAPDFFKTADLRIIENQIEKLNKKITTDFRDFWSQKIGKENKISIEFELKHHDQAEAGKAGKPFLVFWIKDGEEKLYPKQRSKGVRWFTSFYLQLKATSLDKNKHGRIFLIDEPGGTLHARAQEDVIKVFEEIKEKVEIIYTTHSPYLINLKTVYRLLAVQRADAENDKSETLVLDAHKLGAASSDTLSPLYTLMGADFSSQISAFYYISSFWKLVGSTKTVHLLPATGVNNVPQLANLFLGWGLDFGVVVDDDSSGRGVYNMLKHDLFLDDEDEAKKHIMKIKDCHGIEDLFSKDNFKKYVLENENESYKPINSEFMKRKPKAVFALKFMLKVEKGEITVGNLDEQTQNNIKKLVSDIESLI